MKLSEAFLKRLFDYNMSFFELGGYWGNWNFIVKSSVPEEVRSNCRSRLTSVRQVDEAGLRRELLVHMKHCDLEVFEVDEVKRYNKLLLKFGSSTGLDSVIFLEKTKVAFFKKIFENVHFYVKVNPYKPLEKGKYVHALVKKDSQVVGIIGLMKKD